jgi:hypothetical protein
LPLTDLDHAFETLEELLAAYMETPLNIGGLMLEHRELPRQKLAV